MLSPQTLQELQHLAETGVPTLVQLTPELSVLILPAQVTQETVELTLPGTLETESHRLRRIQ